MFAANNKTGSTHSDSSRKNLIDRNYIYYFPKKQFFSHFLYFLLSLPKIGFDFKIRGSDKSGNVPINNWQKLHILVILQHNFKLRK